MTRAYVRGSISERFWAKVDRRGDDECWPWLASTNAQGYGRLGNHRGGSSLAHVVAYELLVKPMPFGLELDHLCRNPACVNPAHLEPVTHAENMLRGNSFGGNPGWRSSLTRCHRGHEFTPENTWTSKDGKRHCRECGRQRDRARRSRKP